MSERKCVRWRKDEQFKIINVCVRFRHRWLGGWASWDPIVTVKSFLIALGMNPCSTMNKIESWEWWEKVRKSFFWFYLIASFQIKLLFITHQTKICHIFTSINILFWQCIGHGFSYVETWVTWQTRKTITPCTILDSSFFESAIGLVNRSTLERDNWPCVPPIFPTSKLSLCKIYGFLIWQSLLTHIGCCETNNQTL
jgi:hypothetical protein